LLTINVMEGRLPARVPGLVEEWAEIPCEELFEMWNTKGFHRVPPLV